MRGGLRAASLAFRPPRRPCVPGGSGVKALTPIADTTTVRRRLSIICVVMVASLAGASQASAATGGSGIPAYAQESIGIPMYEATDLALTPSGFAVSPAQAVLIAEHSPTALAIHRTHHPLRYGVWVWGQSHYEVNFAYHGKTLVDVIVERNGALGPSYTGPLMTAVYARGAYDTLFDAPWVFLPFGLLFLLALITRRPGLGHLDAAMVLSGSRNRSPKGRNTQGASNSVSYAPRA